jgi:hypothetical protein
MRKMRMMTMSEPYAYAFASFPANPVTETDRGTLTAAAQGTAGAGPSPLGERPP